MSFLLAMMVHFEMVCFVMCFNLYMAKNIILFVCHCYYHNYSVRLFISVSDIHFWYNSWLHYSFIFTSISASISISISTSTFTFNFVYNFSIAALIIIVFHRNCDVSMNIDMLMFISLLVYLSFSPISIPISVLISDPISTLINVSLT